MMDSSLTLHRTHPWVLIAWIASCTCLSFCSLHPVLAPISLGSALLLIALTHPIRTTIASLGGALIAIAICIIFNLLVVNLGQTVLYSVGSYSIRLESLVWGATFGVMLSSIICWGRIAQTLLSTSQLMGTIGKTLPTLALCIMMIMHTITRLLHEGKEMHAYLLHCKPWQSQIQSALATTNTLFGNALESSLITSLSMRARGFGIGRFQHRSTAYSWHTTDILLLVGLTILTILCSICTWLACTQFYFYPTMPQLKLWMGYLPLTILYLAPLPALAVQRLRNWRLQ